MSRDDNAHPREPFRLSAFRISGACDPLSRREYIYNLRLFALELIAEKRESDVL